MYAGKIPETQFATIQLIPGAQFTLKMYFDTMGANKYITITLYQGPDCIS